MTYKINVSQQASTEFTQNTNLMDGDKQVSIVSSSKDRDGHLEEVIRLLLSGFDEDRDTVYEYEYRRKDESNISSEFVMVNRRLSGRVPLSAFKEGLICPEIPEGILSVLQDVDIKGKNIDYGTICESKRIYPPSNSFLNPGTDYNQEGYTAFVLFRIQKKGELDKYFEISRSIGKTEAASYLETLQNLSLLNNAYFLRPAIGECACSADYSSRIKLEEDLGEFMQGNEVFCEGLGALKISDGKVDVQRIRCSVKSWYTHMFLPAMKFFRDVMDNTGFQDYDVVWPSECTEDVYF
ncbi:MAG: hypothetical protein V1740_04130 [Candidatus Woesearchaeota archaeon]